MCRGLFRCDLEESRLDITIAGFPVLRQEVLSFDAKAASEALRKPEVSITVNLNLGGGRRLLGCDLTEEYVVVNSKYTT